MIVLYNLMLDVYVIDVGNEGRLDLDDLEQQANRCFDSWTRV